MKTPIYFTINNELHFYKATPAFFVFTCDNSSLTTFNMVNCIYQYFDEATTIIYTRFNLLIIRKVLTNKSHPLNVYMKAYRLFL